MAITGSVALTNQIKPLYDSEFLVQSQALLYFDQCSDLKKQIGAAGGSSYEFPISANLPPATAVLNELEDVTPLPLSSAAVNVPVYEHGSAVQVTELAVQTSYVDVYKQAAYANGYQLAESYDNLVRAVVCQGSMILRQAAATTRATFAGKTNTAHIVTPAYLQLLVSIARRFRVPAAEDGSYMTVIDAFVHHDLIVNTNIRDMAIRQTPEMAFNGEVAYWAGLRILTSANCKGFYGAGAVDATASAATTLASSSAAGATSISVASATNITVGQWLAIIDGAETGNTWTDTNELALVTAVSGTDITVMGSDPGPGTGGGLRYAHASGTTVNNGNSVYPIPIMGPMSITKVAGDHTGPYGRTTVVGPYDTLGRFLALGWYAIVGWQRTLEGWIMRGEVGSSIS